MDDEEEENPVVKEVPVFINQALSDSIVVYQHLLQHGGLSTDNSNVIQCNVKENPHGVLLEVERHTESVNYSTSRGEQIALNVDGRDTSGKNPEDVTFPTSIMDRQTLMSKTLPDMNCAVGVLYDGELHLNPVTSVLTLRPSFKHLDKSDKQTKSDAKDGTEGEGSEEEEEAKQVTVKFARQESERAKKARQRSFGYKTSAKETWYPATFYATGSHESEVATSKMYCTNPEDVPGQPEVNMSTIMSRLIKDSSVDNNAGINAPHGVSLKGLRALPLVDKVKKLLLRVRMMTLSQLTHYLGTSSSDVQDYLRAVQQVAVLVQGCWVVQSDVVYCKDALPGSTPTPVMRSARDFILYLFTKHKSISRRKIVEQLKLPADLVKEILSEVAILVPSSREWQFRLPQDHEFLKLYPEVVQRQSIKWDMKHEQLLEGLNNTDPSVTAVPTTRYRRKSHRDSSMSSDNEGGGADTRRNCFQVGPPTKIRRTKKTSISHAHNHAETNGDT